MVSLLGSLLAPLVVAAAVAVVVLVSSTITSSSTSISPELVVPPPPPRTRNTALGFSFARPPRNVNPPPPPPSSADVDADADAPDDASIDTSVLPATEEMFGFRFRFIYTAAAAPSGRTVPGRRKTAMCEKGGVEGTVKVQDVGVLGALGWEEVLGGLVGTGSVRMGREEMRRPNMFSFCLCINGYVWCVYLVRLLGLGSVTLVNDAGKGRERYIDSINLLKRVFI